MNASNNNSSGPVPDEHGRFGDFGGRFVPETLTKALDQLTEQYQQAIEDPAFLPELDFINKMQPCSKPYKHYGI